MSAREKWKTVQGAIGTAVDGIPGAKDDAALAVLRGLALTEYRAARETAVKIVGGAVVVTPGDMTLRHNDWPLEEDAPAFYGSRPNLTQIEPPYPMRMFYDGSWHPISKITCHVKVAESLRRILHAVLLHYGSLEEIKAVGMDVYDGCYNDRNVRGSTTHKSMHAYGAAIDFDAEHNALGATHGRMPPAVVAIFDKEGWRWGGRYTRRQDWMHFEACV